MQKQEVSVNKLDRLYVKLVKIRDGYTCQYCGGEKRLSVHHIYSKQIFFMRFIVVNGITLCDNCHRRSNKFSAHRTPIEFVEWLKQKKGNHFIDDLKKIFKEGNRKSPKEILSDLLVYEKSLQRKIYYVNKHTRRQK